MDGSAQTIRETFTTLRRSGQGRHRDIAEQLQMSEGELIAAHVGEASHAQNVILYATRLRPDWPAIMSSLAPLGIVMALTRNASCVHEKTGIYRNVSHHNHVGCVLSEEMNLRMFYQQWAHGFAVLEQTEQGTQRSLQFFDAKGVAIHKVFLKSHSNVEAYARLVMRFADSKQATGICIQNFVEGRARHLDNDMDGVHSNSQNPDLRMGEKMLLQQVTVDACQTLLQKAAADGVSLKVIVGNPGMTQIHSGSMTNVVAMGPWINVLDAGFNLHLRQDHIARAWIVKKPGVDAQVTSLALFDSQGDIIATVSDETQLDQTDPNEWRALIERIQQEHRSCVA